jgi:hypothetical protein
LRSQKKLERESWDNYRGRFFWNNFLKQFCGTELNLYLCTPFLKNRYPLTNKGGFLSDDENGKWYTGSRPVGKRFKSAVSAKGSAFWEEGKPAKAVSGFKVFERLGKQKSNSGDDEVRSHR